MAISQITSNSIAAGAVSASDLADGSVTPAKLSTGAPYWDSSSNVGIGTSSPATKLEVTGDIGGTWATGATRFVGSQYLTGSSYQLGMKTTMDTRETQIFAKAADTGGYVTVATGTTPTERMRIDSSGNVGIGTSSPSSYANATTLTVNNATASYIDLIGGGVTSEFGGDSTGLTVSGGTQTVKFRAGSAERMRITANGDVFINSTNYPVVGIEKFGVQGNATIAGAFNTSSASNPTVFVSNSTNGTVTLVRFASGSGGNTVGNITGNGTNTTYGTSSDYRLKENIAPMTGALATVALLKPCTYTWKLNGSQGQGFIAHELQEVVPDCVVGEKDAVDADGNPVYQGIDTSFLVATLTAAIQELKAEFEEYKRTHP